MYDHPAGVDDWGRGTDARWSRSSPAWPGRPGFDSPAAVIPSEAVRWPHRRHPGVWPPPAVYRPRRL